MDNSVFEGIIIAAIGLVSIPNVISSVISNQANKKLDALSRDAQKQSDDRKKESVLVLTTLQSVGSLSEATAVAVRDKVCNGKMSTALNDYLECQGDLNAFLIDQACCKNHK